MGISVLDRNTTEIFSLIMQDYISEIPSEMLYFKDITIYIYPYNYEIGESAHRIKAPFTREHNRSVSSSFQFLERKKRLFTRERNDCVSVFVSVHTGTQSFRSTVFSLVLAIFSMNYYIHACA